MEYQLKIMLDESRRRKLDQVRAYLALAAPEAGEPTHNLAFSWLLDSVPIRELMIDFLNSAPQAQESKNGSAEISSADPGSAAADPGDGATPGKRRRGRPRKRPGPAHSPD